MDFPIIRIELENLKKSINHAMAIHGEEIRKMISNSIDKALDPDKIQSEIDKAIADAIHKSISRLSDNYQVRSTILDIINVYLIQKHDEIAKR